MPRHLWIFSLALTLLCSCESDLIGYSLEQGLKQGAIMLRSKKIDWILRTTNLDPKTKHLLQLTQGILNFAQKDLGMKTGNSYRKYVDIKKSYLTQVVMAAYSDRLESYFFNFPVIGAVPYKGFFDEKDAINFENKLKAQGLDTYRRNVDAFSSLGWFADPIVSTMLESESQLTELLMHELTHLNFYFEGESDFNEAFASYFALRAAQKLIEQKPELFDNPIQARADLQKSADREQILGKKIREALAYGKSFYQLKPLPDRNIFFAWLREHFKPGSNSAELKDFSWNNAALLSLSTYYDLIPAIEAYGLKMNWDESQYLKAVVTEGAGIIPKIWNPSKSN